MHRATGSTLQLRSRRFVFGGGFGGGRRAFHFKTPVAQFVFAAFVQGGQHVAGGGIHNRACVLFWAIYFLISAWRLRIRVSVTSQTVSRKSRPPSKARASASRPSKSARLGLRRVMTIAPP